MIGGGGGGGGGLLSFMLLKELVCISLHVALCLKMTHSITAFVIVKCGWVWSHKQLLLILDPPYIVLAQLLDLLFTVWKHQSLLLQLIG